MQAAGIPIRVMLAFLMCFFVWRSNNNNLKCSFPLAIAKELGRQLDGWLEAANFSQGPARAIIAP